MTLADSGVDVFNASDEFFNNICHEYDNTDGKDIIINDRRTDIYKNVSFCEQGCSYNGIDYELMIANCICNSSTMQNNDENINNTHGNSEEEKVNFNSIKKSVLDSLFDFNFDIFKCYNLVFNIKYLKGNIGFYSMIIMFILQVICFCVYLSKKLKSLKYFLLIFNDTNPKVSHAFPPKKENNYITNTLDDSKEKRLVESSKIYIKSKFEKDKKKKLKNKKEKNNSINIEEETNNESHSKRKLHFMDDDNNLENKDLFNLKIPPENNIEKLKNKKGKKLIFSKNLVASADIEIPMFNIQNKKQKKIPESEREKINSIKQEKEIKSGSKINKDKIYNIKVKDIIKSEKKTKRIFQIKLNIKKEKKMMFIN